MTKKLRYIVFGREVIVEHQNNEWKIFWVSSEGKRRQVEDVIMPSNLSEKEIEQYLADIFHEFATKSNSEVKRAQDVE